MERFTDTQTYYIVFDKSLGGFKWWHLFLNKEFRHCFLMKENEGGTLVINPLVHVMSIKQYPNTITDMIQQELQRNPTAILQHTVHYGSHYKHAPMEAYTCVSVAKRLLGVRSRLLTPKALYHELNKAGATTIKPYCIT